MGSPSNFSQMPDAFINIVRTKAYRMVGQAGLTNSDVQDLEQTLYVRCWQSLASFDPSKGDLDAFARTVANRAAANIVRNLKAAQRHGRRTVSLSCFIEINDGEVAELAQEVGQRELCARTGGPMRDEQGDLERTLDVNAFIVGLPYEDRELVRALKWKTVSEVARDKGVARTTIASRVRRLRMKFEEAGLRDYLR